MLQQPSDFIMYQKLPLDLNMHTAAEVNNLPPDFRDISLQLQAQRAGAATQAFFFDAYSVQKAATPQAAPLVAGIQGMYDLPLHAMYNHPIQAMYDPLRHHHQQQLLLHQQQQQQQHLQPQHPPFVPPSGLLPTTPWQQQPPQQQQQESRGSWFPNWQEVFHGFAVGKDGVPQEKQNMAPSFEQNSLLQPGDIVAPPVAAMRTTMTNAGEAQQPSLSTDTTQRFDPCPLAPSPPHSQLAATLLPHSNPGVEKKRDDNIVIAPAISTTGALPSDADTRQSCVDSDCAQLAAPSPPVGSFSHSATALLPNPALEPEKGKENSLVPCTDLKDPQSPPRIDAIACKYTTQSPSWLPQGWITEVQTRRTGSTAGTRDKYYKDLVSGRRFRSRNEVIHYLQTGKGRLRKRRRKKVIASSAFGGHHNLLPHQPRPLTQEATSSPCLFLAPQPIGFLLGPLVNPPPVQTEPHPSSVPSCAVEEGEVPCQSPGVQPTTSSMPGFMLGLKQPIEVRTQKLPIQRKVKMLSPKKCEDKQASRLWQWLQKPVRTSEQPERQDADKQVNNDGKNGEDSGREPRIAQRTAQLGKDIETAQKTIMHLGKEMQATVEKLTREIQTVQKDLRLEMQEATHVSDGAMSNVVEAAYRLDGAMGNVTQATQNLVMAMGLAVQATQLSASKVGAASQPKHPQGAAASVISEVSRSDMEMVDSNPRAHTGRVAERPDIVMEYSMHAATQPQEVQEAPRPDVAMVCPAMRGCATQAVERADLAMGYFVQAHRMPDGTMGYSAEAAQGRDLASGGIRQLVQMPDITMHYKIQGAQFPDSAMCMPAMAHGNPFIVMSSPWTQASQRSDLATGTVNVCGTPPLHLGELSRDTRLLTNEDFAVLKPKLDLSMLSPSLSSRQRAKIVQRMKAKHSRGLLVLLGRKLCFKALRKTAVRLL